MLICRGTIVAHSVGIALVAAVTAGALPARAAGEVKAVATFSIIADFLRQVGGDRVQVKSLVGPNGDAHVFNPSPADAQTLASAQVVFVNGLGLEGWIDRLIKASSTKARVIVASQGVKPIEGDEQEGGKPKDSAHNFDPHAWQSVANAKLYVANIRDGLSGVDPAGKDAYEANAKSYLEKLDALEQDVVRAMERIPPAHRKIITSHDAFGYFAATYKMQFIAPQGLSTEAEASAKDVAKIIRQIKAQKIPAVFLENISDTRMIERIAKETGAKIGGKVYSDALSEPGGPAATYVDMIRNNIKAFETALAPQT